MERIGSLPSAYEQQENPDDKSEKFLNKIKDFKDKIAQKLGLNGEKLTEATDEALVDAARETISAADQDGERTEDEKSNIHEAVSSVVVQGAMEEAGYDRSTGENPILSLDQEDTEADLVASIATLHQDEISLPTGEDVAELAVQAIEDAKWSRMVQVGKAEGSNAGGWYEYPSTGERYYVKFYRNPEQMRVEYIANAVYAQLGIKAVQSELVNIDGRDAIASPAVEGARDASIEDQQLSVDVQKGFVADAFLANWDVIGQEYNNVVKGDDGGLYRIDNGGSLIFRAQGRSKEYPADDIPELRTMLDPNYPAGKVFGDITPRQIQDQAKYLLDHLSEDDIRNIVEQSGLEGETRDQVLNGMLGRRAVLEKMCAESNMTDGVIQEESAERHEVVTDGRLGDKLRELHEQGAEQVGEYVIFPRGEIVCDHDHIEGQKLNLYDKSPTGRIEVSFKLRGGTEDIYQKMSGRDDVSKYDAISCWHMSNGQAEPYALCGALSFERNGVKVFISEPDTNVRTAHGLVKIEAPSEMAPDEIEHAVADIIENDLGVPDALSEVPDESERDYQEKRYAWEHRIDGQLTPEQSLAAHGMVRTEVAPGYSTLIEPGKHLEYLNKYGENIRAYHSMYSSETASIVSVLTSGLLCSSERYERGIYDNGMSTPKDLKSGGGDSVFTRVGNKDFAEALMTTVVIFKPDLFDRSDWYSYDRDRFGSTEEDEYRERITPDTLFSKLAEGSLVASTNEQMFRTGISPQFIENVRVAPSQRDEILAKLHEAGVSEIAGRPIEEIVVPNENYVEPRPAESFADDDWGSEDEITQDFEAAQQSTAQKKEAILSGAETYDSAEELLNLCESVDDLDNLCDAIIEHGGKDKLKADLSMFIVKEIDAGDIKAFTHGALDPSHDVASVLKCAQEKLSVDLNQIIELKKTWQM